MPARLGIASEFIGGLRTLHFVGPCVTVFGSARHRESHRSHRMACEVGAELARVAFTVMTGGGPGITDAANRGVRRRQAAAATNTRRCEEPRPVENHVRREVIVAGIDADGRQEEVTSPGARLADVAQPAL